MLCFSMMGMAESVDTLSTMIVTGTRKAVTASNVPFTVTSISREKLTENGRSSVLPTIMEQTPGLFCTSRGMIGYGVSTNSAGAMKVRGIGGATEMLVVIDGQPQYAGIMGHPIPDAYQTMMAEKVEVLRGPASMLYGSNAMGGVINIITRENKQDGSHTHASLQAGSYGTVIGEVANSTRKGKFNSFVGLNYQRTDGHRPDSHFDQTSGFVKLGYDFSEHWKLSGDANYTRFNFDNPGPNSAPLYDATANINRGLANVTLTNSYGCTNGALRFYYDWGHHEINDGHKAGAAQKDQLYMHNDFIGGLNWYQSATFFKGNLVTVGLDWQHFGGDAWNEKMVTKDRTYYNKVRNQHEVAAYVDFRQDITQWLTLDAGIRTDHHSQTGMEWVPQGGMSFHVTPQQDVKLLASKGFRNPVISEMYMFAANPDLAPERMMNYELAYSLKLKHGHVGANVFMMDGENLISRAPNPSGAGMLQQNIGEFSHWGIELEGDYRFNNHWSVDANYSFLHMDEPVTGAPEHKLHVSGTYTVGKFSASLNLEHIHGLYLTTGKSANKEQYTLLGATARYQVTPQLRLFVRGDNLLAQRYQTYEGFYMPKANFMGGATLDF